MSETVETVGTQNDRPVGIVDPDGRIWPFGQRFTSQMSNAGCRPVHSRDEFRELLRAQMIEDRQEAARRAEENARISPDIIETDDRGPVREPVDLKSVVDSLGIGAESE